MLLRRLTTLTCLLLSFSAHAESEVAGALNGVAAIAAAVAPIGVAAAEAAADKAIAGINAATTVEVAAIQMDTTKYLATAQAEVALAQAVMSKEINQINNDGQTERLGMQLAEVRAAREDAMAAEREKRWIEMYYNDQRIQLAKEQADANYKLAQATLQANLVQAGLISGVKRIDSSAGLTVSRTGMANGNTQVSSTNLANFSRVPSPSGSLSVMRGADGQMTFSGEAPRTETSKRLLAAALGGKTAPTVGAREKKSVSGMIGENLSQGSTRGMQFRVVAAVTTVVPRRAPASADYEPRREEAPVTAAGGHSGAASRGAR